MRKAREVSVTRVGLLEQRLLDLRMTVTLVDGGVGREEIEVLSPLDVPDPDALAALQDHVERVVVVGAVIVLEADEPLGVVNWWSSWSNLPGAAR